MSLIIDSSGHDDGGATPNADRTMLAGVASGDNTGQSNGSPLGDADAARPAGAAAPGCPLTPGRRRAARKKNSPTGVRENKLPWEETMLGQPLEPTGRPVRPAEWRGRPVLLVFLRWLG
jgi:hypothetical protein